MKTTRLFFRMLCIGVLALAVGEITWVRRAHSAEGDAAERAAEQVDEAAQASKAATRAAESKAKTVLNESVAGELEARRLSIEAREQAMAEQEGRVKEREHALDLKIKEMEHLREAVTGELESQKKNNEERVSKMVAVFETMTPKSASGVFETLDDWLAVEVLKRMNITKVAKIMNIMEKTRSAKLSEMLTGFYHPDSDRKVSSIKPTAAGQVVAQAPAQPKIASAAPVPAMPSTPQKSQKKGGDK